ncbi:divergent polysaccharide deacetylase family protein [Paenibacillus sp. GCM10012307]|nr:divergent polysaccharide deacetylase family protein [Paenibacillus roseus]
MNKTKGMWIPAIVLLIAALLAGTAADKPDKKVAIVIDDFGNGMKGTEEMMKLSIPFTAAVMPFMPTTKQDAEAAFKRGLDVIVHMPMEPNRGKKEWLGPGAITTDLSDEEIRKRTEAAIDDVPHASGMNNHMGSKVTADERVMRIVLTVCKERGLFFLDSRTTSKSVIPDVAAELDVPLVSNHIFLDDVYTTSHIVGQVARLKKKLADHAAVVAIGHVGPPGLKTSAAIRNSIGEISKQAQFVRVSELLPSSAYEKQIFP